MSYRYNNYINDEYDSRRLNQYYDPSGTRRSYIRDVNPSSSDFISQSTFQPSRNRYDEINRRSAPPPIPPRRHHHHHHHHHNNNVDYLNRNGNDNSLLSSSNHLNRSSNDQFRYGTRSANSDRNLRLNSLNHSSNVDFIENNKPSSSRSRISHSDRSNENRRSNLYHFDENPQINRREQRQTTNPNSSSRLNSNVRSSNIEIPSNSNSNSNGNRSIDNNLYSTRNRQSNHPTNSSVSSDSESLIPFEFVHPVSLLTNILQSFLGLNDSPMNRNSHFNDDDDDDDRNPNGLITPMDLIGLSWIMQRPTGFIGPTQVFIHFSDLTDLLGDDQQNSVSLSDDDIERIPTISYKKSRKSKSNDEKCSICLSEYKTGEILKVLKCKHLFHPDCIQPWLKTSIQCPVCRAIQKN